MFKSAYLKLTIFYVLIVMTISLVFSSVLFRVAANELNFGFRRQVHVLQQLPFGAPDTMPDFDSIRVQQLGQSQHNLKLDLVYWNLLILLLSSVISYLLARKTLHPIEEMMIAQNQFTADASHELRTPLTAMKSEIEVSLREKKLTAAETKALLESNLEEIGKLEALSNALLRMAKYQESTEKFSAPVSLEEVIVEAYGKVESLAREKSIEFDNKLQKVTVTGDQQSLVELFVILLDNAIKYSPEKSKIYIEVEKDKKHAIVKIKDEGVGIKASDLPYIFNRFYRADSSRSKDKVAGYGLGLSIAQKITELHKGTIKVTSQPGNGTTFTINLPL